MRSIVDTISLFFHSGIPYIIVSIFFIFATAYGISLIKNIRDTLNQESNCKNSEIIILKKDRRNKNEQNDFKTND